MNNKDIDNVNRYIEVIKNQITEEINQEYTEYKNKCLDELDYKLEAKRNSVVKNVLDGIDIAMASNEPFTIEPTIMIRIEKKIIMKEK